MSKQHKKTKTPKAEKAILPTQVAHYHVEKGRLPESMKPQMRAYLFDLNQVLHQAEPQTVSAIVACVPTHWADAYEEIELYVFGSFRSHYRVIGKLADIFAKLYAESIILPVIRPVTSIEWDLTAKHNGMVKRDIQRNGCVIYER
jgi:hypothetical protein